MKRFLSLGILFVMILLLSACGEPPTVQSDFSASFTASRDDVGYAGTVTKSDASLTVIFSEPAAADGMEFCWENSALSIRYAGHSTQANADYLPSDSIPATLHNTLTYLSQAAYTGTENGEDRFTLPTPRGDAELTAENGVPTSLTDPNDGTFFYFEPFSS